MSPPRSRGISGTVSRALGPVLLDSSFSLEAPPSGPVFKKNNACPGRAAKERPGISFVKYGA
jgi:hypothetical protein